MVSSKVALAGGKCFLKTSSALSFKNMSPNTLISLKDFNFDVSLFSCGTKVGCSSLQKGNISLMHKIQNQFSA